MEVSEADGRECWECLIIGGGPAGLTAATYLARFCRKTLLVNAGQSRAAAIPASHNQPGFCDGISGRDLLKLMREQAQRNGAQLRVGQVEGLRRSENAFSAEVAGQRVRAQRVLLATGIRDLAPDLPGLKDAVAQGVVRYCPICDGYEVRDKRIGVFGTGDHAAKEASFLRTYSRSVTVFYPPRPQACAAGETAACGITLAPAAVREFRLTGSGLAVELDNGDILEVDVLYPALGCAVRSDLAKTLGARCNPVGCVIVDEKQRTSVDGLYAVGDVVSDLHQISVAEGHAAVAATAIHNSLPRNWR